jgi:hypothetical protein
MLSPGTKVVHALGAAVVVKVGCCDFWNRDPRYDRGRWLIIELAGGGRRVARLDELQVAP